VASACMSFATEACTQLSHCSKVAIQRDYGALGACVTTQATICTNELSSPSTGTSAADREACAGAISGWACSDFLSQTSPPTACAPKTGMLASGRACAFSSQCQSGFCAVEPKAACGTCATAPVAGAACTMLTNCGQGLVCSLAGKCAAPGGTGASCGPDSPCQLGFACVGYKAKTKTMGTCQALVASAGLACSVLDAKTPSCDAEQGLVCNAMTATCDPLTLAAPGGACGEIKGQGVGCSDGASCSVKGDGGVVGTCTAALPDDAACERTVSGAHCATQERCIVVGDAGTSGTCEFNGATACK
jgi:hypothetical protein